MTSSLETYTNLRGNSMDEGLLEQTANQLVAPGQGILAADESNGTMSKRLAAVGVEPSAETRRSYRANLLSTDDYQSAVSGGRFTQHEHDGYQIPTGAVHMIPHGKKGPFAKLILGKRERGGLELGRHGVEFLPTTKFACQIRDGELRRAGSAFGILL